MSKYSGEPGYQAFRLLQYAFMIFMLLVGFDKFTYTLTDWSAYLPPFLLDLIKGHDRIFNAVFGVIEIGLGIGVLFRPTVFAYFVAVILLLFGLILMKLGHHADSVLRVFCLMLSAFALGKLGKQYREN